jgi:hyperosmotically inducible periplasmic protein
VKRYAIKMLIMTACLGATLAVQAQTSAPTADAAMAPMAKPSNKATPADRALGKAVRRALSKAQGINISNMYVRARGGAVTLSGSVDDSAQISHAEEVAKGVDGVTSVSNKLSLFHGGNG